MGVATFIELRTWKLFKSENPILKICLHEVKNKLNLAMGSLLSIDIERSMFIRDVLQITHLFSLIW